MTRELLLKTAEQMPEHFHMDDLFERLIFLEEIEKGIKSLHDEGGISHDQLVKEMDEFMYKRRNEGNNLV